MLDSFEREITERVNVLADPQPQSLLCQPTMVVDQACDQEFFKARKPCWSKVTSINTSATANKQFPVGKKIVFFFTLVLLKLHFK